VNISQSTHADALTVLIVDDEEAVRRYFERILSGAGHRTAVASDAAEALRIAATIERLDMLITDMMMPEVNGDELARRLRMSRPDLKVLYVTGYSERLFDEKHVLWADEAFLEKPCTIRGLLEAVSLLWTERLVDGQSDRSRTRSSGPAGSLDAAPGNRSAR
jgi:CheY-like chemotaxis protein